MNRQSFMNELRRSMSGHFSAAEIQETVDYYEDYIDTQLRKGKTEEEVLAQLGDPRLLSKSMRAAGKGNAGRKQENSRAYSEEQAGSMYEKNVQDHLFQGNAAFEKIFRIPWFVWIIILLVLMLIIGLMIGVVLTILLHVLPFLLAAALIYCGYRYFVKK